MEKSKEKGITLVALIITIIVMIILTSVTIISGISTLEYMRFSKLKKEFEIIQSKVDELYENDETDIGQALTNEQKSIFNVEQVTDIIYKGVAEDDTEKKNYIQNGFRYCDKRYIENIFDLKGIDNNYIINVEYRYVIFLDGFEYEGKTYYMSNQFKDGIYNVSYNDKNSENGTFNVSVQNEYNRWRIEITNIQYDGYISDWQVEYYKSGEESNKKIVNGTVFYLTEEGNYYVRVFHNNIDLNSRLVLVYSDDD